MPRILLIDDDSGLGPPLAAYFARFELQLEQALRPSEGLARLAHPPVGGFDTAILDVMLPEMDGFALCREIRKTSDLPILMLTARGDVMDRVVGLELGADDYLPKPFEPRELVARVQTVLRRRQPARPAHPAPGGPLHFDGLLIDPVTRQALRAGQALELTSTEFDLLHLLAREPGRVFSRDDILNQLRGHEAELYTRAVDIVVSRLRKKLEPLDCIKTVRNAGYSLGLAALRSGEPRGQPAAHGPAPGSPAASAASPAPGAPPAAPIVAALAAPAPDRAVFAAGGGADAHLHRRHAARHEPGLARRGPPPGGRLRGPPGGRPGQPAPGGQGPGPGAAPAHHAAHQRAPGELGVRPRAPCRARVAPPLCPGRG